LAISDEELEKGAAAIGGLVNPSGKAGVSGTGGLCLPSAWRCLLGV
jgi:hypothetical protein